MMDGYLEFFGLRENPFRNNPDARYLYFTDAMTDALAKLTYGIRTRQGLFMLSGEAGTGKTTLIRHLLEWLAENQIPSAFLFNPHVDTFGLYDLILAEFGIARHCGQESNPLEALHQWSRKRGRADGTAVVIVDEAQGLSCRVLEALHVLLNFESGEEKPIQVLLAGQPELDDKLRRPELRPLRQRISVRCRTAAFTAEQATDYVVWRLRAAGALEDPAFEDDALNAVYFYSLGIPRVINLLCDRALIASAARGIKPVPLPVIEKVACEFQFDERKPCALSTYASLASREDRMGAPMGASIASLRAVAAEPGTNGNGFCSIARPSAAAELLQAAGENVEFASPPIRRESPVVPGENSRPSVFPPNDGNNSAQGLGFATEVPAFAIGPAVPSVTNSNRAAARIAPSLFQTSRVEVTSSGSAIRSERAQTAAPDHPAHARAAASAPPRRHWQMEPPRRSSRQTFREMSGRKVLSAWEAITAWSQRIFAALRSAPQAGKRFWNESLIRWLRQPLRTGRSHRGVLHKQP